MRSFVWYLDAVNDAVLVVDKITDDGFDFSSGNIFALPTERVARTITEIEVAQFIGNDNIAGQEGGVAFSEYVMDDFFLRSCFINVAKEFSGRVIFYYFSDEHARFI